MTVIGVATDRLEDPRLLTGRGRFVDDRDQPGELHLAVVRSQVAHGRLESVDVSQALEMLGVVDVVVGADLALPSIPIRLQVTEDGLEEYRQPVLATDRVRYVGEPVAAVVATDPYLAEDAAEAVVVTVSAFPVRLDPETPPREELFAVGSEVAPLSYGYGQVDDGLAAASHVIELDVAVGRHAAVPLETRGLAARWDHETETMTIDGATKVPHFNRQVTAEMLGIEVGDIHLTTTDAGGGFGARGELYPEDVLVPLLARRTGHPVKWVEDRGEHLVASNHSRQQRHRLTVGVDDAGHLLALRAEIVHDNGAYLRTHGVIVAELAATMLPGPYRLPAYEATARVVFTNKTPVGTYRGPGRYEATFSRERLMDVVADRLDLSPAEVRRRNLLRPDELPHDRAMRSLGTSVVLDVADYPGGLSTALDSTRDWVREVEQARQAGRHVGIGIGCVLEKSGLGPWEKASVEVDADGNILVAMGGASLGQGIETVMAQIAAEVLGAPLARVEVVHGDTDLVPEGIGSWASRTTVVGGSAVLQAARALGDRLCAVAAELAGCDPADVALDRGMVATPGRRYTFAEVVTAGGSDAARGTGRALHADATFSVDRMTYPNAVHVAKVEVDPGTGGVAVLDYHVTTEVGRAIHPRNVVGQVLGGVAQGVGGALLEEFTYREDGQPTATTFMDYLLPTAGEVPVDVQVVVTQHPTPHNPLGARGAGEAGVSGVGAAIANAVCDAVGDPMAVTRLPITPARIVDMLAAAPGPISEGAAP